MKPRVNWFRYPEDEQFEPEPARDDCTLELIAGALGLFALACLAAGGLLR